MMEIRRTWFIHSMKRFSPPHMRTNSKKPRKKQTIVEMNTMREKGGGKLQCNVHVYIHSIYTHTRRQSVIVYLSSEDRKHANVDFRAISIFVVVAVVGFSPVISARLLRIIRVRQELVSLSGNRLDNIVAVARIISGLCLSTPRPRLAASS